MPQVRPNVPPLEAEDYPSSHLRRAYGRACPGAPVVGGALMGPQKRLHLAPLPLDTGQYTGIVSSIFQRFLNPQP